MIQLIYFSSAIKEMTQTELLDMLEVSRIRNKEDCITGMLLYSDRSFIQIIEGEEDKVMNLYGRIAKDSRHKGMITVNIGEIESRAFDGWSMGFKYLSKDEALQIDGFSEFINKDITPENILNNKDFILNMLTTFKKNNR
jgi:hypothetical protein